jgi:uncharacterized protein YjbJ (UPF0337 family)
MSSRLGLLAVAALTTVALGGEFVEAGPLLLNDAIPQEQGGQARASMVVNQDQLEGKWKQFKGELKRKWAEFTEDDLLAIEGRVDKLEGKIQERYGDRREEVKEWVDEWFDTHGTRKEPSQS